MTPEWKWVFRLNETSILVIRVLKKHLIFEVFIWRDLKMCVSLQRNPHFWHPGFQKNLAKFPFSFGICVMWGTCGHHLFHSTPQGLAQSLHIQHIFTFGVMSPHIAVRPFEPHWIYFWLHFLLKALRSPITLSWRYHDVIMPHPTPPHPRATCRRDSSVVSVAVHVGSKCTWT